MNVDNDIEGEENSRPPEPPPYTDPYTPARLNWALETIGWSGHELGRRIGMEYGSVRQMRRQVDQRPCPQVLAIWVDTLARLFAKNPPPDMGSLEDDDRFCPYDELRELLACLGWSSAALARKLNLSEHVTMNWCRTRGARGPARAPYAVQQWLETLAAILEALPLPVGWEEDRKQRTREAKDGDARQPDVVSAT